MKSSVLMSVYRNDNPQHLRLALNSIYDDQTVKPDEIVVVFDGKLTEELYLVLEDFRYGKESIVHFYPQSENKGLGEALRIGTDYCHGELIFRMDADDISLPTRFEQQIEYMEIHPEIDVLGGIIQEFQYSPDEEMRTRLCPESHEDIVRMGKHRNPMNHVTVCIRKKSLVGCGGYKTLAMMEDYYLWLRMIGEGYKLANLPITLVYVRTGNGFLGRRRSKTLVHGRRVLQQYMLSNHLVNPFEALYNMISIIAFVYLPSKIQQMVYKKLLRKS